MAIKNPYILIRIGLLVILLLISGGFSWWIKLHRHAGATSLAPAPSVCIKPAFQGQAVSFAARPSGVQVDIRNANDFSSVLNMQGLSPQSDGSIISSQVGSLQSGNLYDIWIKEPGFLGRRITDVSGLPRRCFPLSPAQSLIPGDFDGDNIISVADLTTLIRAFNGGSDPLAQVALTAYGKRPGVQDLVTLIRTFHQTPNGDLATTQSEMAKPADSFVDSIGVHTAIHTYQSAHSDFSDYPGFDTTKQLLPSFFSTIMLPRLEELGVRHFRHFFPGDLSNDPTSRNYYDQLAAAGIHMNVGFVPSQITTSAADFVKGIKSMGPVVESFENVNEYDFHATSGDSTRVAQPVATWTTTLHDTCRKIYTAFKADPATKNIPILGPTFTGDDDPNGPYYSVNLGTFNDCTDYGAVHYYFPPVSTSTGREDTAYSYFINPYPQEPLIVSETGFHTSTQTNTIQVTPVAQAKYLLRQPAEMFSRGVTRTYFYDLIDLAPYSSHSGDGESNFGLLTHNNQPKPSFTALKNLISILKEPGANFQPTPLGFSLTGTTDLLGHTLLEKSNGDYYMILYRHSDSMATSSVSGMVTLTLPKTVSAISKYDPLNSAQPTSLATNTKSISLDISDSPIIVCIHP